LRTGKKALLASVSKSFKHVSVFLLSILLSRYLTLDDYGSYLQVMLIATTAIYFSLMGIPSSIYYFYQRVNNKKEFIRRTILMIHALAILSVTFIVLISDKLAVLLNNPKLTDVVFVFVLFILFQIPIKLFEPLMISTNNVMGFVKVNLFFNILFFFSVAIPLLLMDEIIYVYYSMIGFFALQYTVISISIAREYIDLSDKESIHNGSESCSLISQLKYSLPIGASGAIAELGRIVDKLIVSNYFSPSELAIYARGAMEIPMLSVIINSLGNILMPKFVKSYKDADINNILMYWHRSTVLIAIVVYPLMVLMIVIGDILIPMLFTEKFNDSIIIFQIYTCTLIFRITTYDSIVRAIGKTNILLKITAISLLLNILLTIVMIENFGIIGAPIATFITILVVRLEMLRVIKGLLKISFLDVFPWFKLFKILLISLISILIVSPLLMIDLMLIMKFFVISIAYGVVYLICLRSFQLLDNNEIDSLNSIIPEKYLSVLRK